MLQLIVKKIPSFSICYKTEPNGSVVWKNYKKFPFEVVKVDDTTEYRVLSHFKDPFADLLEIGPEKWIMPKNYSEVAEKLYNIEARLDDLTAFPISGTGHNK